MTNRVYIDPPSIPSGVTIADYRRTRFAFAENRCKCGAPATTLTIGGRRCESCVKRGER